jgi:aryl-alcohol dehydrogenase-like predicted oxidoreductase
VNYRQLGRTGVAVSDVGLGTWQLGGADWGAMDDARAVGLLHRAAERGVTFFDTADVYGMGASEQAIGRFLRETRETVYVATKAGRRIWVEGNLAWPDRITLDMARRATQRSLTHLGVDALFLQQWHCLPTDEYRRGDVFEHLETLKREGLIQHWGCSVESVEEARLCMAHPGCASLQVIFNVFRQKLVGDLLPDAVQRGVGILARVPLASGLLTGRFLPGHQFAADDHRRYNADGQVFNVGETFAGLPFDVGVRLAERVRDIFANPAVPMAQLALRWILDHPAVSTAIPGATTLEQADSNAASSDLARLSPDVHERLRELYEADIAGAIRGPY